MSIAQVGEGRPVLEDLKEQYGGSICETRTRNPRHKPISVWTIYGANASDFLAEILPWLRSKTERAKLAITFQERMGKLAYLPPEELEARDVLYDKMRTLNQRGVST